MTSQMSSQSNSYRTTAAGRSYVGHFHDQDLYPSSEIDPPEEAEYALLQVSRTAAQYGFSTLFHAALALAEQHDMQSQRELVCFAEDGGLAKFIGLACRKDIKRAIQLTKSCAQLDKTLCEVSREVYRAEWKEWVSQAGIRMPLGRFSLEHVQSFEVTTLYTAWRGKAPFLCSLLESLALRKDDALREDETWDINDKRRKDYRRRCRHIVMAISCIGALRSQQVNVVQGILSYFMYACRVPKRVIMILNKWGLTVSYSSVHHAVRAIGQCPGGTDSLTGQDNRFGRI
jgi:hypothetical protein